MKKDGKLSQALVLLLTFPIAVLMVLFLLLYTPTDFVRYCFSNRRREMKRLYGKQVKYSWIITLTDHYRIFELIAKNDLPICLFLRVKILANTGTSIIIRRCFYMMLSHILMLKMAIGILFKSTMNRIYTAT